MRNKDKILIIFIVVLLGFLRFYNLGYSDFIPDETTVMYYLKQHGGFYSLDFLFSQRKGPLQFVTAFIPFLFTKDVFNGFAFRFPFALANVLGMVFFYKFLLNITKNKHTEIAFLGTMFFGVNGFIVAFGRVVQYQSLNLLFSSLALFYFSRLTVNVKEYKKPIMLGSVFFALSILSHWDAILILPIIIYFLIAGYRNTGIDRKDYKRSLILSVVVNCLVLSPFLVPYVKNVFSEDKNIKYIEGRFEFTPLTKDIVASKFAEYKFKSELYNPFFFLQFIAVPLFVSLVFFRKLIPYFIWLISVILVFLFLVKKPGTHLYNVLLPLTVLCTLGTFYLYSALHKFLKVPLYIFMLLPIGVLYFQSYLIFVDSGIEYPWNREEYKEYKTKKYTHENLKNNIIGFPLKRNWSEVAMFIKQYNESNPKVFKYVTNEDSSIANYYLDLQYGTDDKYFAIGVKDPLSFANDYSFPQIRGKSTIHKVEVKGSSMVRIYLVESKNNED